MNTSLTPLIMLCVGIIIMVIVFGLVLFGIISFLTKMPIRRLLSSIEKEPENELRKDSLTTKDKATSFLMGSLFSLFGVALIGLYYRGQNQIIKYKSSQKYAYLGILLWIVLICLLSSILSPSNQRSSHNTMEEVNQIIQINRLETPTPNLVNLE
jgi:drug/metabolite transporter (DMT)-like permease